MDNYPRYKSYPVVVIRKKSRKRKILQKEEKTETTPQSPIVSSAQKTLK